MALEIVVNGKTYPCRQTMGAMLRFKRETGKEASAIGADSVTDLVTYLWCCVLSACKHDGVEFTYTLEDFADSLTMEDVTKWTDAINQGRNTEDVEKKSSPQ